MQKFLLRIILKIYNVIKDLLPEEERKLIENKLTDIKDSVEPKLETHLRSKKRLTTNQKTQLYNNCHMICESKFFKINLFIHILFLMHILFFIIYLLMAYLF